MAQERYIITESISRLILYRPGPSDLLTALSEIEKETDETVLSYKWHSFLGSVITLAEDHGFGGNLWQSYLAWYMACHENSFSRACEINGAVSGGINRAALHDMSVLRTLFFLDLSPVALRCKAENAEILMGYDVVSTDRKLFNKRIQGRIMQLCGELAQSADAATFKQCTEQFYREYGVGTFGLHKAFRVREDENNKAVIVPITNIAHVKLSDLVGYEIPKKKLIDNTVAFVSGRRANNCLLFGDAGTGKSSSIKAILNQYYDRGLRIIEIYKHQFRLLNQVIEQIKNRNYRFILYMDDLSFEDFETDYKYLKAVIEGGLERKPDNILIYATSNRRHLIRENYEDKYSQGEEIRSDMHTSDTVQEKLSLAYRFGVTIYFGAPDKKEFQNIVRVLAERSGIDMPEEELLLEANKWELAHGGLSGRTAQQFIDYILGSVTLS